MKHRRQSLLLFVIAGMLLLVPALHALTLHARVLPVRDDAGHIIDTEPNPAFVRERRLAWILGVTGLLIAGVGAGVRFTERRSAAEGGDGQTM